MTKSRRHAGNTTETVTRLCEYYLPMVLRYTAYLVEDIDDAEKVSLNSIRNVISGGIPYHEDHDDLQMVTAVFTEARRLARQYLGSGAGNPVTAGLDGEEREVLALRIGARLPTGIISGLTGYTESEIRTMVCRALRTIRYSDEACL